MHEFRDAGSRTETVKWETVYCPRCKDRTTFYFVTDDRLRCSQCEYEEDRKRGLGLDSGIFK